MPETDYQEISGILTNDVRRDFTFIHPEFFLEDKYQIDNGTIKLNNAGNFQEYKVMFLTGCKTISVQTREKLQAFYKSGGTIIPKTQLPYKSSEMGKDVEVINLVNEILGLNPQNIDSEEIQIHSNSKGGVAVFIPKPNKNSIQKVLDEQLESDVRFLPNPVLAIDFGKFNYIHKIKDGQHIYMFTNSSDEEIETEVLLRGKLNLENRDPQSGITSKLNNVSHVKKKGQTYTSCKLTLEPVHSLFRMGEQ